MNLKKLLMMFFVAALLFAGCSKAEPVESTDTTDTTDVTDATESTESTELIFELTSAEQAIFDKYITTLDNEIFRDVDPVSIAKIFIQYGVEARWEQEYAMYSQQWLPLTKAEYQEGNEVDLNSNAAISRKEMADYNFALLKDGAFTDDGNNRGHIDFKDIEDHPLKLYLGKSEAGIWEIKYDPFTEWES